MLKIRGKSSIPTDDFILKVTVTKVTENSSKVTENEVTLPEKLPETLGRLIEKMTEKHDRLIGNLDKLIEKASV